MMGAETSITRRLMLTVLALELLAAVILIAAVTNHERHVQFESFDANLRAMSNALLGRVQEAESSDGSVLLDLTELDIPSKSVFLVTDEHGRVLGAHGRLPPLDAKAGEFTAASISGHRYRLFTLGGERIIDPGVSRAVRHHITVVYGLPEGKVWHEIVEAVRFFAIATIILLGLTSIVLSWAIRRSLLPIRELAQEADKINSSNWQFDSPASARNFSELLPLTSAIEKTIARLQRAFEQQRRMTNDAAHELKTDVAIIKSSFQILSMKRRTLEEYEKGVAVGVKDIGRLEQTVQKMLTLARLEQGPLSEIQTCRIDDVLLDTITQSSGFAEVKNVTFVTRLEADCDVPLSREDASLLGSNVILNALQHTPEHGNIEIATQAFDRMVTISVRDSGDGIHETDLPFIFDPFYRGDPSRSRKSGGTGLGLSICKAICDRVNGTIEIDNHSEGGAEVRIQLPLRDAP